MMKKKSNFVIYKIMFIMMAYLCTFSTILAAEKSKILENKDKESDIKEKFASTSQANVKNVQTEDNYSSFQIGILATKSSSGINKNEILDNKDKKSDIKNFSPQNTQISMKEALDEEFECINVVVPMTYQVAFNPYGLEVQMGNGDISTDQVLSKKYGIVNKSSKDVIVSVIFTVKNLNEEKIIFVDSDEAVQSIESDKYAIYLALVSSDEGEISIEGTEIDLEITGDELSDITMPISRKKEKVLYSGRNKVEFKLSSAVYEHPDKNVEKENFQSPELVSLASDGTGIMAFTFSGSMNEKAEWNKLSEGIKISATYAYEVANSKETAKEKMETEQNIIQLSSALSAE